jgi:farnesyl-diphosphate farnesyltransferase
LRPAATMARAPGADLLRDVLPGVSRSFALSLRLLPTSLRVPFGVTYLVARAADTITDTRALAPAERRRDLEVLRAALRQGERSDLGHVGDRVAPDHASRERELLQRLPELLAAYRALRPDDFVRARTVLFTLTQAMLDVLARFPPEADGRVGALETRADLDRYTYMNAGCVGEFWTDMVVAHRRSCARWNLPLMRARGVRFGQGLQLVNVLRDLPRDLGIGRCYLPRTELAVLGLTPEDLLAPGAMTRVRPLVHTLIDQALAHLEEARRYTIAVPRREPRLRLACALPLLIGLATLARLGRAENLLDPTVTVKIPRSEVRRHLVRSAAVLPSNRGLDSYARRLAAAVSPQAAHEGSLASRPDRMVS